MYPSPDETQGYVTTSFRAIDGVNVKYDSSNVYVLSNNIVTHDVIVSDASITHILPKKQVLRYNLPRITLDAGSLTQSDQAQFNEAIAVNTNYL